MHNQTRNKLKTAKQLYTVEPEPDKAIRINVQLPKNEYVEFYLNEPFPSKVQYRSLEYGGLNYNPPTDTPIIIYTKKDTIRILKNSIGYRSNNTDTINKLIELIEEMDLIF